MEDSVIVIIESIITLLLCVSYYYLFGRIKTSKSIKIAEIVALFVTIMTFGLVKNTKIWFLFFAFYLIGAMKKIISKNERPRKGHHH